MAMTQSEEIKIESPIAIAKRLKEQSIFNLPQSDNKKSKASKTNI